MARESKDVAEGGQHAGRLEVAGSDAPSDASTALTMDADKVVVEGGAPPSARIALSEKLIVSAALAYIDEFGLPGLSMRRLGSVLGVEAMSLYRYVAGREELLDAIANSMTNSMSEDSEVFEDPTHGWQDFLQRLAHGVRRVALTHPKAFPLVASRPAEAPWLRPPLRSLHWVEAFLRGLIAEGFSHEAAVRAYRAFSSFLLGHLLLEVATQGADLGPLDVIEEENLDENAPRHPLVRELRDALTEDHAAEEFEESLEDLLNRIELIRMEH
ncbi:MAG: TetR family transcriptional regulator [Marmoricola sp.]|jgi:AcrR family transcriptional regulator|nr:TetR family transcriptional regulator [Marmoricola sp.]